MAYVYGLDRMLLCAGRAAGCRALAPDGGTPRAPDEARRPEREAAPGSPAQARGEGRRPEPASGAECDVRIHAG